MKRTCCLVLIAGSAFALSGESETVTTRDLSLRSGDKVFTSVVLTNTRSRIYTDLSRPSLPGSIGPDRCLLDAKAAGVIWKIVLRGAAVSAKEISVSDETGRAFPQVCWSSSGTVYQLDAAGKRTGGGPQTEFLAAGPDGAQALVFKFGAASATARLSK